MLKKIIEIYSDEPYGICNIFNKEKEINSELEKIKYIFGDIHSIVIENVLYIAVATGIMQSEKTFMEAIMNKNEIREFSTDNYTIKIGETSSVIIFSVIEQSKNIGADIIVPKEFDTINDALSVALVLTDNKNTLEAAGIDPNDVYEKVFLNSRPIVRNIVHINNQIDESSTREYLNKILIKPLKKSTN